MERLGMVALGLLCLLWWAVCFGNQYQGFGLVPM